MDPSVEQVDTKPVIYTGLADSGDQSLAQEKSENSQAANVDLPVEQQETSKTHEEPQEMLEDVTETRPSTTTGEEKMDVEGDVSEKLDEAVNETPDGNGNADVTENEATPAAVEQTSVGEVDESVSASVAPSSPIATPMETPTDTPSVATPISGVSKGVEPSPTPATAATPPPQVRTPSNKKPKVDMASIPTRQYLDTTVVPVLLQGLSALAKERPAKPINFLGTFLLEKSSEYDDD